MTTTKHTVLETLVRTLVRQIISEKYAGGKKKGFSKSSSHKRKKKPGGGLTDMGAKRRVDKAEFDTNVRAAIEASQGDVADAAKDLDVGERTLYGYMQDNPAYQRLQAREVEKAEREEEVRTGNKKK